MFFIGCLLFIQMLKLNFAAVSHNCRCLIVLNKEGQGKTFLIKNCQIVKYTRSGKNSTLAVFVISSNPVTLNKTFTPPPPPSPWVTYFTFSLRILSLVLLYTPTPNPPPPFLFSSSTPLPSGFRQTPSPPPHSPGTYCTVPKWVGKTWQRFARLPHSLGA